MLALLYDTETTGLDPAKDRIVQHGAMIFDLLSNRIIDARTWLAWEKDFPAVADTEKVHGWSLSNLLKYARHPLAAISELREFAKGYGVQLVVAHNGVRFDKNMLAAEIKRVFPASTEPSILPLGALPWLDTMTHATYSGCPNRALLTVAAFHGYINPFAHDALADCYTMAHILTKSPTLVLEMARKAAATQSLIFANLPNQRLAPAEFNALKDKMKAKKFVWQDCDGHHYERSWIRLIEREQFTEFASSCDFQVNLIKDLPPADEYTLLYKELSELNGF